MSIVLVATGADSHAQCRNNQTNFSNGCKFAIKGGGHAPQRGAANQPGGVTIDLGAFKQVSVSSDRKTISIGPGVAGVIFARGSMPDAQPYDPFAALIHSYGFTAGSWQIANNYEYTKIPAQPYPPVFKPFTDIKPQTLNTMRVSVLTDFTVELAATSPAGRRQMFIALTYGLSGPLITEIFNAADAAV
ncbi:MAG: hypothetical protein LQ337_002063 [Flavoplaca oasis]|nr:MAG: hypothetical protein LQ337_002063 [Flavoplaca oasis]